MIISSTRLWVCTKRCVNVAADILLVFLSFYYKNWFSARLCTSGRWRDPKTRHNLPRTHSCVKTTSRSNRGLEICPELWSDPVKTLKDGQLSSLCAAMLLSLCSCYCPGTTSWNTGNWCFCFATTRLQRGNIPLHQDVLGSSTDKEMYSISLSLQSSKSLCDQQRDLCEDRVPARRDPEGWTL